MNTQTAIQYEKEISDVFSALLQVHKAIDAHSFDRALHHLVVLRASQINRCGFCVKMHLREAREDGENDQRLDSVIVWDQVNDFSERERAALAWTEALTELNPARDLGPLRAQLHEHFTTQEISILTADIAMINLWNRINVSKH